MWDVFEDLIKVIFSLFVLLLNPILYFLKFVLYNIVNFISLLINSILTLIIFFGLIIKSLSEYLEFIPLIFRNLIKFINIVLEYIAYIFAFLFAIIAWFFGFAENGNEDDFF
jgi:hypothetical protein